MDLDSIRLSMRIQRAQISEKVQELAAESAFRLAVTNGLLDDIQHAAFYYPAKGELSPLKLLNLALERGINCYLPRMHEEARQPLEFRRIESLQNLERHAWGIAEPGEQAERIATDQLDLVIVPLVAFDHLGHRIGMGKGYYDRTFAFLNQPDRPRKPRLVGLAYDFQEVGELPTEIWDVDLDAILTDTGYLCFSDRNNAYAGLSDSSR